MVKSTPHKIYKMSFTSGGLFFNESVQVAELYNELNDWQHTKDRLLDGNLLQARTANSAKRRVREICARLGSLAEDEIRLLINGTRQEQQYLLWIAVCKQYVFIRDFMVEVVREKYLRMDLQLTPSDYEFFFENKAEWHEELERLKSSTRTRLRQALFQIMREAEIISPENMIIPGLLTKQLTRVLAGDDPSLLNALPVSDMDINTWLN